MANVEHLARLRAGVPGWNEWYKSRLAGSDDGRVDLAKARLRETDLRRVDLRLADLRGTDMRQADLTQADLSGADLTRANLAGAELRWVKFTGANLRETNLSNAALTWADLTEAYLSHADVTQANLSEAKLAAAVLYEVDFTAAKLPRANLRDADLTGAALRRVDLDGADLTRANLTGANLTQTRLTEAILIEADLTGAAMRGAWFGRTVFGDTNLTNLQGLKNCTHRGPSIIDHQTLTKSGQLPRSFLRGCGLPDQFIDYLPSLLNQALEFYSCFISYSTKDQPFADRLHADLQDKGVRCWFAPHDMQAGKKIHEQIDEAIRVYDRLLLILSEHSMNSEWVKTEIAKARQKEIDQGRRVLFPISLVSFDAVRRWSCFDSDTGKDSAREIREYFVPDFSEWKNHDGYEKAFSRLIKDLKSDLKPSDDDAPV